MASKNRFIEMELPVQAEDMPHRRSSKSDGGGYVPPTKIITTTLGNLLKGVRSIPEDQQRRFGYSSKDRRGATIWAAGDLMLVQNPCIAVVGARKVSREGAARARRVARELADAGVVVVSGLAKGVDTEALNAAIEAGGKVIAVIGTPLNKAYPAENRRLQEKIYREHLLISQFALGRPVFQSNFPERNKLMAAISDATVIVEASDTSGSLHQAAECVRLKRWLFIAKSLTDNPSLRWPKTFLQWSNTKLLSHTSDILDIVRPS